MRVYDDHEEVVLFIEKFAGERGHNKWSKHKRYLLVGLWFAFHFPFDIALLKTRVFMMSQFHTINGKSSGKYSETITHFWFTQIYHFVSENYFITIYDAAYKLLRSELHQSFIHEYHYSNDLLQSQKSKQNWQMPDLDPVDQIFKKKLRNR